MEFLQQSFSVTFEYRVNFTSALFDVSNPLLINFLKQRHEEGILKKIFFVIDSNVLQHHPHLSNDIKKYFDASPYIKLIEELLIVPGGETAKNSLTAFNRIVEAVSLYGIDRHSYLAAIGGGSVLDMAGFAASVSHRGIKHIRIPTTVLSQNDSGVGVKNGINFKEKKNFLGTFTPPIAVFNDDQFLSSLSDRNFRSGISEAVKVALIKDDRFFTWLEEHAVQLTERDHSATKYLIMRCAELHMGHIASGDPFETGSSRPLDFGHWSAHKLEQLTGFEITHGEAVAMGMALDTMYSCETGLLTELDTYRIIDLLIKLRLNVTHPLMNVGEGSPILAGLEEFREHLGGQLTIMLLSAIGKGVEVHEIDTNLLASASKRLMNYELTSHQTH